MPHPLRFDFDLKNQSMVGQESQVPQLRLVGSLSNLHVAHYLDQKLSLQFQRYNYLKTMV